MSSAQPPIPPTIPPNQPMVPPRPQPNPQPKAAPALPPGMNEPALPAPPGAAEEQDRLPHTSIMADPRFASLTGAATSIFLHAIVIIVAFVAAYEPARDLLLKAVTLDEQNIIPTAELATDTPGGLPNPGGNNDPTRAALQNVDQSVTSSDSWAQTRSENLSESLSSASTGTSSPIGQSLNSTGGLASQGGGKLAKFGAPGGGMGIGPQGAVFGNGGNAYRIIFIVDGTGTMVGLKNTLVMRELKNTISRLKPTQSYNVIFFNKGDQGGVEAADKNKLIDATSPNNKRTFEMLDRFSPEGSTNPMPAIELAFKQNPQLLYILSDGEFDNLVSYDEVIKKIDSLNEGRKVKVNTIMFGDRDARAEAALKKIAESNGGRMVFVELNALMKQ